MPKKNRQIAKMHTVNGIWYYMSDSDEICYFILVDLSYKMVKVASLLNEINNIF